MSFSVRRVSRLVDFSYFRTCSFGCYFIDRLHPGQNNVPRSMGDLQYLQADFVTNLCLVIVVPLASASFLILRDLSSLPAKKVAVSKTKTNGANIINPVTGVGSGPKIQNATKITT